MKFEYPIKLNDSSVQRELGSNNQFGFYPIGRLNAWHGGIHVEGADMEIKAIADGEVIAYRLPKKYSDEKILEKTHQYSNGFVLIKHYYNSPKGQELTFYSLYLHLMSKDEILTKNKKIPDIFAKKVIKVTANDNIVGLNAINMLDENDIPFIIPYGATVQFDDIPPWLESIHWSKDEKHKDKAYRRIKYTDSDGKIEMNILISTAGSRIAADVMTDFTNEVKINTKEDKGSQVGALVRRTTDTNSEILRIIPKGAEIEIESEEGDKWAKVIDKDGKSPQVRKVLCC